MPGEVFASPGTIAVASAVARDRRRQSFIACALVAPAALYLAVAFLLPIGSILFAAFGNGGVSRLLPTMSSQIAAWQPSSPPSDAVANALIGDLRAVSKGEVAAVSRDLNTRKVGFRSLLIKTRNALEDDAAATGLAGLARIDERWADTSYWAVLKQGAARFTPYFVLSGLDLRWDSAEGLRQADPERRIYLQYLWRTFSICAVVTIICAVLAYPMAYFIAQSPPRLQKILIFALLVPFWTSVLVRTAAWVIVLQRGGLLNGTLTGLGLIDEPLTMIYNRFGVYVAMSHVLLPFMVLPIYSVMKAINPHYVRAALSLGASPVAAFRQVYLPLSLPGLSAGSVMVFMLGLGYYVTPALVGGATDQMESGLIANFAINDANWQMAAAVSLILLFVTAAIFLALRKLVRVSSLSMG